MKFETFLETVNIKDDEKKVLISLRENLTNLQNYNCKKIWVKGCEGAGKTGLVKELLTNIKVPIIYLGLEPEKGYVNCKDSSEVLETAKKHEQCVIFLDNVPEVMKNPHSCGSGLSKEDMNNLFRIFDHISKSQNKTLFLITPEYIESDGLVDRLDIQIEIELPSKESKQKFIKDKYSKVLNKECVDYLSEKTVGYNFKDIGRVIKKFKSSNKTNIDQLKEILSNYTPSALQYYTITHIKDLNLSNIIGREKIKEQLERAITSLKNKELASKFGINTKNLLFFYGEPGTGKTFMAKAIAGELKLPIISINASSIISCSETPHRLLKRIINLGIRFGNSILLFDEAEKIFGRHVMEGDGDLQGDLQGYLDGAGQKIKSLVIFTLNEQAKFGEPLKDRFLMFKFDKPETRERTEFLKRKYDLAKDYFSIKISAEAISNLIGKQSFREIEKIWDQTLLKKLTTKDKSITKKDFEETIELLNTKNENVICG